VRNPNRIDPMLETIGFVWKKFPDFRLGQLIVNAVRTQLNEGADLFNVEDGTLEMAICSFIAECKETK
jgi:hypothetical protein